MDISSHSANLPIEDYNKLIKATEFIDLQEITKEHCLYPFLMDGLRHENNKMGPRALPLDQISSNFKFYIKINKP